MTKAPQNVFFGYVLEEEDKTTDKLRGKLFNLRHTVYHNAEDIDTQRKFYNCHSKFGNGIMSEQGAQLTFVDESVCT